MLIKKDEEPFFYKFLSIAKEIVSAHKGNIKAEYKGNNVIFTVKL